MRALCASLLFSSLLAAASAADLKVKVIDPQSAAVAGAQVSLTVRNLGSPGTVEGTYEGMTYMSPVRTATTSSEGVASFTGLPASELQVEVLAPGFAPQTERSSPRTPAHHHPTAPRHSIRNRRRLRDPNSGRRPKKPVPASPLWKMPNSKPCSRWPLTMRFDFFLARW